MCIRDRNRVYLRSTTQTLIADSASSVIYIVRLCKPQEQPNVATLKVKLVEIIAQRTAASDDKSNISVMQLGLRCLFPDNAVAVEIDGRDLTAVHFHFDISSGLKRIRFALSVL